MVAAKLEPQVNSQCEAFLTEMVQIANPINGSKD